MIYNGGLYEIDTLPITTVAAYLHSLDIPFLASDTDLQLRYRPILSLSQIKCLAAYDHLVFERDDFSSFYLRSDEKLKDILEENCVYSPYLTHLEATLLCLVLQNEEEERNALIESPLMSQERLHNISLRLPHWIMDEVSVTAEEYGLEIPSPLVLSTEIWLKIANYCDMPSLSSFVLVSRESKSVVSKVTISEKELLKAIQSKDISIVYFARRLLTRENVIRCCELAIKTNYKSFQIIFREGERLHESSEQSERDAFREATLQMVRREKNREHFIWLHSQSWRYIYNNHCAMAVNYLATRENEKELADLMKSGNAFEVKGITKRLELEKRIKKGWATVFRGDS